MNKKIIIIIVVIAILGISIFYALRTSNNNSEYNNTPVPVNPSVNSPLPVPTPIEKSVSSMPATAPASVSINIKNFSFNPATLTVKAGTKVTWVNDDAISHTVTSDSDNLLDSPTLAPGQSFSFTFINSGTTAYHCNIHKMMKGTIIVQK